MGIRMKLQSCIYIVYCTYVIYMYVYILYINFIAMYFYYVIDTNSYRLYGRRFANKLPLIQLLQITIPRS